MTEVVELPDGRRATYETIGTGRPTLMFPGGAAFGASYMRGDAELFAESLQSFLIDPHGSGGSTAPADLARTPLKVMAPSTRRFVEHDRSFVTFSLRPGSRRRSLRRSTWPPPNYRK